MWRCAHPLKTRSRSARLCAWPWPSSTQLDPQDAASLLLHELHGYTSTEIAESLGISADAVRKRLSRAIKALRTAYERHNTTLPAKGESVR